MRDMVRMAESSTQRGNQVIDQSPFEENHHQSFVNHADRVSRRCVCSALNFV